MCGLRTSTHGSAAADAQTGTTAAARQAASRPSPCILTHASSVAGSVEQGPCQIDVRGEKIAKR